MFTDKQLLLIVGLGGLALWYMKSKAVETVKDAANAVNPVNPDNLFHQGVNRAGAILSDDEDFSLGSWVYDLTHQEDGY